MLIEFLLRKSLFWIHHILIADFELLKTL